jgi:cell wall-associated NlpC family hydrolase
MLDPRLHAFRTDLADRRLQGRVAADRFIDGHLTRVVEASVPLKSSPDDSAAYASELLFGEAFRVFEDERGWSWGQCLTDDYVGYVKSRSLGEPEPEPTHHVTALGTFIYPEADLKSPPLAALSLGSSLTLGDEVEAGGTRYRELTGPGPGMGMGMGGAVVASHVAPVANVIENDYVAVAERFLNVPYLWGGRTSHGVDCSSLIQLSLAATGQRAPRDTDLQEKSLGHQVEGGVEAPLHPGDLIYWSGHVGMMIDGEYLLHASGPHMMVVIEPLTEAIVRIGSRAGAPTAVKRLRDR